MSYNCNCGNPWNTPRSVCGTFDTPVVVDLGRCSPYRVKISCEAPTVPLPECSEVPEIEYHPENPSHPFTVWSILFDENCSAILDQDDNPIQTLIQ